MDVMVTHFGSQSPRFHLWQLGSPVEYYSASLVEAKRMIISKDVVALVSPL
jgi:hypothetical protein